MDSLSYDDTGKIDLSDIYNQPDPRQYFSTLSRLDYRIPQEAKALFQQILEARRRASGSESAKVVDVGCSYGVNAALLKFDLTLDELSRHYETAAGLSRSELLARDADFFQDPADPALEVVGVDAAEQAVRYALDAGILDGAITTNLEAARPTAEDAELIAGTDLVISTGCYGYVSDRTFERILDQCGDSQPWMAHTVLRMFDFSEAEQLFDERGYVTEKVEGLVPQRRFASREERQHTLDNLAAAGIDALGLEEEGWYFAELFVSRPREIAEVLPIGKVLDAPAVLHAAQ